MDIRTMIEEKLGNITDTEFDFAIQQYERNAEQSGRRKQPTSEALDELATTIDFYRRRCG